MNILVDSCVFIDSFDPQSLNHSAAVRLLDELLKREILITMPAHGWFEVQCSLQRLSSIDHRFVGPAFSGKMEYPIKLLHIDKPFIQKYSMASIPYIKTGDHIFIAVAKVDNYPLITSDKNIISVSKQCSVRAFTPEEFMKALVEGSQCIK